MPMPRLSTLNSISSVWNAISRQSRRWCPDLKTLRAGVGLNGRPSLLFGAEPQRPRTVSTRVLHGLLARFARPTGDLAMPQQARARYARRSVAHGSAAAPQTDQDTRVDNARPSRLPDSRSPSTGARPHPALRVASDPTAVHEADLRPPPAVHRPKAVQGRPSWP